jgi:DNA mismatch repair protein MutS2
MISEPAYDKLEFQKIIKHISNFCVTDTGKLRVLNTKPSCDYKKIIDESEFVNQAKRLMIEREHLPLEHLPDLGEDLYRSRIEGSVLDSKKILSVLGLLVNSRLTIQYLKNNKELAKELAELSNDLFSDKLLEHHIQNIINEKGNVKDGASKKLAEIRKDINNKKDDLIRSVNRIIKSLADKDIVREDYITLRDGRIVIPIKSEHKRHIRGFIHSESSTGQTVYIEPEETLDLNNEILSLTFAERREIERILKELTKKISTASEVLIKTLTMLGYIDSIFSRAKYSIEIIGSFPQFDNKAKFALIDGRHPLLLKKLGKEKTIPLNFSIDNKNIIIITGPNAGGKTVVLKTIGLMVLLVQSGIPIPANPDSNFHIFNNVLLDIGDEQSLEDDLSTFSSHLSNIKNIIENADQDSLVLVDEIGTGTDPSEGAALATAFLIELRKKSATVLATTHHGSLKLIASSMEGFENAAMEFDHKLLKPTYVFKQGIPGSSYAFEIAKRIGLSEELLNTAKDNLDIDKHKIEEFLSEIESQSFELQGKLKKMEIENSRLAGLSNLYKDNLEKLNKEKKEILKKATLEAEDYLKNVNKRIENVIKELRESKAGTESIKSAKLLIDELKSKNKELIRGNVELSEEKLNFKSGDYVIIKDSNTIGQIIDKDESKNRAVLQVGAIKMTADISTLIPAKKQNKGININSSESYSQIQTKTRIDIRGQRALESEFEIIKFVDEAYSGGLDRIEILHGKGTGALKKTVLEILKKHPAVNNFYFAPIEMGGDGITIVELKRE